MRVERDNALAVLVIDRPPLNLWDAQMDAALGAALDEVEAELPRAVLITAEGRVVTGGVDVNAFVGLDAANGADLPTALLRHIQRVAALPCPVVFAAHALCLTWGFELALATDLIVASNRAEFALVEQTVGLSPFMGGTQRLALRAGPARAKEVVFSGARYSATTLASWGVVNHVYPADQFPAAARKLAHRLADGPTAAHAMTKQLADLACAQGAPAADAATPALAGRLFETVDARNGIASFLREGAGHAAYAGR